MRLRQNGSGPPGGPLRFVKKDTAVTTIGILATSNRHTIAETLQSACPDLEIVVAETATVLRPDLSQLDGLIVATQLYDDDLAAELRHEAPRLRWMQVLSSGVDSILKRGLPPGVTLTSSLGVHVDPVADHALALLLGLFRHIPDFARDQSAQHWAAGAERRGLREIAGSRATMLGYGHIGRGIVHRLRAFGADVTAVNRSGTGPGDADRLLPVSSLAEALDGADILIICLPGEAAARPLIDAPALDLLAAGAVVVNVGRGSSLDTDALVTRLQSGQLAGAALDVFAQEPLAPEDPLWHVPGLLISPHVAGNGNGTHARLAELTAENARRFLAGEPLRNVVAT